MKGLLYKDAVTLVKQMRFYLLLVLIFSALPLGNLSSFAVVYAAMLPFSAIAYDEQAKWPRLAAMLPYTPGQLVLSKYIIGWAGVAAALVLSALANGLVQFFAGTGEAALARQLELVCVTAALALMLIAVVLPMIFRFGAERGRALSFMVIVLGAVGIALLGQFVGGMHYTWQLGFAALLLAVAANGVSLGLSRRFYQSVARGQAQ